jgi:ribosome-binding ATPase
MRGPRRGALLDAVRARGEPVALAAAPGREPSLRSAGGRRAGAPARLVGGAAVSTRIGIVGMPNAGKSSLFNALTKAGAETANYPFTTIEPNVAVVPVRDRRLEQVARTVGASEIVWDTVDFHDIAGLVGGAHEGEGLGNRFLANIRETDAIVHVVRAHGDERVVHHEGRVDPMKDIETIEAELALADLEQAERRLERVGKQARGGDRVAIAEQAWLSDAIAALQAGRPVRGVPVPAQAPNAARDLGSLTAKPVLFVANVDEGSDEVPAEIAAHASAQGARAVAVSARIESELAELEDQDAAAMRAELGVGESGLERVVREAFELLRLIAFFTAGEAKPAQSWHLRRGLTAWHAAGEIHSDIQKGFVRAEVIGWRELVDAGGYARARERGALRLEGRHYEMGDGEVITVKFTP